MPWFRTLLFFLFQIVAILTNAQHANHWIFGQNVHIEFQDDTIVQYSIGGVNWLEGTSTYADKYGSLKYFVAGDDIRNANGVTLTKPIYTAESATQGIIILKHPESDMFYFISSTRLNTPWCSTLNQDTFVEYLHDFAFSGGEKQQAVHHQNQRDIWYANHAQNGDSIYFFLIKKEGLLECPVVTHTKNYYNSSSGAATQGQMKFSPDGRFLAEVTYTRPFSVGIYSFNAEYPSTDSFYVYSKGFPPPYTKRWYYGAEFAPNGKSLFVMSGITDQQEPDPPIIYQLVLDSLFHDIKGNTWISIDSLWGDYNGCLQLAPNGKIYHAVPGEKYLGVINNPNSIGAGCNYDKEGLTLDSGGTCLFGLPTFNQSYFYHPAVEFSYEEDCFTNEYAFTANDSFNATTFNWHFVNQRSGKTESKSGKAVRYEFNSDSLENIYEVTLVASSATKMDSIFKTITIRPKLTSNFLGKDTFYCEGDSFNTILRTPQNLHCIHWMGEEPEATIGGTIIRGYEYFHNEKYVADTAGQYTVRITNKAFCRAYDTINIEEKPLPKKSILTQNKNILTSSVKAANYQWYRNDTLIGKTVFDTFYTAQSGYYQVKLESEFGCFSEVSDSLLVDFSGIENIQHLNFKLYPNPSDGEITVDLGKASNGDFYVYTLTGKLVLSNKFKNREQIEFTIQKSGSYLLLITDLDGSSGQQLFRVVK